MGKRRRSHVRSRPREAAETSRSVYHQVLCNQSLALALLQFQDGVYFPLLPRYRAWSRAFLDGSLRAPTLQQELHLNSKTDPRYILHRAIFDNDISAVRQLHKCRSTIFTDDALHLAASCGHLELSKELRSLGYGVTSPRVMDFAAAGGHLDICVFFKDLPSTSAAIDNAATQGHLEIVQLLNSLGNHEATTQAMDGAVQNKHFSVVQYLHAERSEGCTPAAMDGAALNGDLAMVTFLHSHRTEGCTTEAMDAAATHGFLSIVQFLHSNRTEGCTTRAMNNAATSGYLDVVQFLHEYRAEGKLSLSVLVSD
ncbi:unnamed protein product [Aphanomyces euteiches]